MNNLFRLICLMVTFLTLFSCDHKEEKNEINRNLADAAEYCRLIATDSPQQIYDGANFVQLCSMGGWPENFDTAKFFRANGSYNNAQIAADLLDNAGRVAYSINASEIMQIINEARNNLLTAANNFETARENRVGTEYDYYINLAIGANNQAIQNIEHARRILYQ